MAEDVPSGGEDQPLKQQMSERMKTCMRLTSIGQLTAGVEVACQ